MSTEYMIGVIVGIAVVIGLTILIKNVKKKEQHYDEMQLKIRADGYRIGYMTTLCLGILLVFGLELGIEKYVSAAFALFTALIIGIIVFAVYCVEKEAFFSIGDKGKSYSFLCLIIVAVNGYIGIGKIVDGSILVDNRVVFETGANLVSSAGFLVLLVAIVYKKIRLGKEETL